ncbi:M1 family peptidase [Aequorivita sp. H23M31]|uniref:M1 family peptidase n=1 Tax=Aequorivita ciconiae TaxID=2494375 RepID=A0A410G625_9FLAO|nr:M1 family metallopeptidase [Aequorivita sp. H23M31]QAA82722.1 M1 family peptidase [Aequorivita sp. H23M31]
MKQSFWMLALFLFSLSTSAQYDPSKIFVPDFYQHNGNTFRSASGKPSADYWQNEADYTVKVAFNVETRLLSGDVTIDYTNNSPDDLDALWLQMDQNTTKNEARGNILRNPNGKPDEKQGYRITKIRLTREGKTKEVPFIVDGTRMQIRLQNVVKPKGKIQLAIEYSYELLPRGGGWRSGYMDDENGKIFEFSYWYPRMCVYDDYYGWNTLPFIGGGEMYLDYGTIDYQITVPADQIVIGSGILLNEKEILNSKTLDRLDKARKSENIVFIRSSEEIKNPVTKNNSGNVTWHFKMENTRDVAWAMSSDYIWDAAKINLPSGKTALAQSVYPVASTKNGRAWSRSTEMLKYSIENYSQRWFEYPYAVASSVAGSVGGMEFPGLAFNYWDVEPYMMFLLASHEIGHTWFPMIVGSDERRNPFMDEGFNTFMNVYAQADFNNGELAPKRDGEYAPNGGNPADEIIQVIKDAKDGPTLMTPADNQNYKFVHPLAYFKSAFGLVLLREVILGPDKFDYAFRQYIKNWAYKHPRPEDFFRSMDNGSGEDLTWFWQGWYHNNWQLDQAISKVEYTEDKETNGIDITVTNKRQMVMPILVSVEESNGKTHNFTVPVDIWKYGADAKFHVNTTSKIKRVLLDAGHQVPDIDRANNEWKG